VFCVSVKVKLTVPLLCVCVHSASKSRPRNDLYCVGWDIKLYSLTRPPKPASREFHGRLSHNFQGGSGLAFSRLKSRLSRDFRGDGSL